MAHIFPPPLPEAQVSPKLSTPSKKDCSCSFHSLTLRSLFSSLDFANLLQLRANCAAVTTIDLDSERRALGFRFMVGVSGLGSWCSGLEAPGIGFRVRTGVLGLKL